MTLTSLPPMTLSDEQLWEKAHRGDRDAFAQIVERYQSLICSLAYCACGDFSHSEDVAQETFVEAWRNLGKLREPARLRGWLCGIARNRSAGMRRRERHNAALNVGESQLEETPTTESGPVERAVSREEADLLWRTLESLPATYREPLILFYREHQSVAEVAAGMELSEDSVRQRLSRGRALLREELAVLVESTLIRTRPAAAFTAGVLAALPLMTAPKAEAAAVSTAAVLTGKAISGATKGALSGLGLGVLMGPAIGMLIGLGSTRLVAMTARSEVERAHLIRSSRWIVLYPFVMSLGLALTLRQAGKLYPASPVGMVLGILVWLGVLLGGILWAHRKQQIEVARIRSETGTTEEFAPEDAGGSESSPLGRWRYYSPIRFLGLPILSVTTAGFGTESPGTRTALGWIVLGEIAVSPLFATGAIAVAPVALGPVAVGVLGFSTWGLGLGVIAMGSVSIGWSAFGVVSVGWKAAWGGGAAVARDYAVGGWVHATQANTAAARNWFREQWFSGWADAFFRVAHWWILVATVATLGVLLHRVIRSRRDSR